ncbi:tRNA (N6-threonylcarbamoyladenosine(37)-N6)-methyltransferase TrmO [Atopomonas sediminilitoris]|uniref:tRNA (N6-threonylcarbamoyladenosine(37)-N6)-methyltransferase TrmO n=1 Tax=Atopomonas sediminilitoris TaxID=2919919 RepID=UPI001F4E7608|nr:tRNA (N6-threonylcarbamoyladenosine(37)-N6)-methyltransferase TrmO [Atopomonas sediminilitoris]MCJ8168176.1 tRNA (N6-threonylcarbamoyladenosine(37)-N6)-methyltransferase TrmO [Atopomonas sediminilitoris]
MSEAYTLSPVGYVRSCFAEKFGIPRQPQLAPDARAQLILTPPYDAPEAVAGLEQVSHVWLLFVFHRCPSGPAHIRVRPPRLGGNQKLGVFASRATHRPNPLGQSVVRLDKVEPGCLWLSGVDLLDGTPVLDIKPYVPYADEVPGAFNQIASAPPTLLPVQWTAQARADAHNHGARLGQPLLTLIEQCLAQDPKPAYQTPDPARRYGMRLWDVDVHWHYPSAEHICVLAVQTAP